MSTKLIFSVTLAFLLNLSNLMAATIYARSNGDWDQTNRWSTSGVGGGSCGCVPGIGDDVIIDGYDIDIDGNTGNVSANSVVVRSDTRDDNSRLRIQDGVRLTVTNDFTILGDRSGRDQTLRLEDNNSQLDVGGNFLINQDTGDDIILDFEDNSSVSVTGNFTVDKDGGDDIDIMLNETNGTTAQLDVGGDVSVDCNGVSNASIEFFMNGSNSLFNVDGSFTISGSGGNDNSFIEFDFNNGSLVIDEYLSLSRSTAFGALEIDLDGGNITVDSIFANSSGTSGGDQAIWFFVDDDSQVNVTNGVDVNMSGGDDFYIYINDNQGSSGQFNVGGNMDINRTGGDDIEFVIDDDDSQLLINGNLSITSAGGEQIFILLDNNGLFQVDGDLTITHSSGQNGEIELSSAPDVPVMIVGGNMNVTYSGGSDAFQIDLNGGTVTVTGNVTMINSGAGGDVFINADGGDFNVTGNFLGLLSGNDELLIDLDEDSQMNVTGNMELAISGGNDIELHLGENTTNSTAQLNVTGNLTLDHNGGTGGDDIQFLINDNTEVHVGGVFTMDIDGSGSAGNFYCRIFDSGLLDVNGNFVMTSVNSGFLEVTLNNSSKIELGGNFVRQASPNNFGLLISNAGTTIEYNGTGAQEFAEDAGAGTDGFTYENVIINNSFGTAPQITMEGEATVNNQITFTDGIISSNSTDILVIADDATATGASDASHVDGPIRKVGNEAITFPIGDNEVYRPLTITAPGVATDAFEAQYFQTDPDASFSTASLHAIFNNVSRVEYWILDRTTGSANVSVTLTWNATSSVTVPAELRVARWNGSQWNNHGNGGTTGNAASGSIITSAAVSTFSPFTLGAISSSNNPLPIELIAFNAQSLDAEVLLSWSTATETNNDFFTLERSSDGQTFKKIGQVDGAGNSSRLLNYAYSDTKSSPAISYYRLKQTDFNGTFTYSKIIQVDRGEVAPQFIAFPNPFIESLNLKNVPPAAMSVQLVDIYGRVTWKGPLEDRLFFEKLPSGIYILQLMDQAGRVLESKKLMH